MATGAAIGSVVVGGAGLIQSKKQSDKADDSMNRAISEIEKYMAQANIHGENALEFAQGLLENWEDTFGGIQDNLSDYYNNLDPDKYAAEYKSNLYENIDKQTAQLNATLDASGLQSAGMKAQTEKEAAFAKATGGAQADLMADDKVASMQQGFLNFGESQRTLAQGSVAGAHGNLGNIAKAGAGAIGGVYERLAGMQGSDAGGWMSGGLDMISGGLGGYAGSDV